MRIPCILLLTVLATAGSATAGPVANIRPEISDQLTRAIELEHQGRMDEAERLLLRLVREAEAEDNGSVELALILNNLSVLYATADRYADADRHFKHSIRILETIEGDLAQQLLARTKLHLAGMYLEQGRTADAAKLDLHLLFDVLRNPEDKTRVKTTIAALALVRKDVVTAERLYSEALAFWREPSRVQDNQADIATILNNLGVLALRENRTADARELLEQSLQAWHRAEGPDSPTVVKAMANIGTAYVQAKEFQEAANWFRRSLARAQDTFGEYHPFTVAVHQQYAKVLKKAGLRSEAKQAARAAAEARGGMTSPSIADFIIDYSELVESRRASGK